MFFEKENLSFNLLDVLELKQKKVDMFNSGRNFNALSFRFSSNALLKTETEEYRVADNFISYVPARLNYRRIADIDDMIIIHFDTPSYYTKRIEYFEPKDPDIFASLFRQILDCWDKKETGYKYKCSAILNEIFAQCYIENFKPRSHNSKIEGAVEHILRNYKNSSLTVGDAARRSFMSEVYFRRLFKSEYGISPQKYIVSLRIQNAIGLISTGYYSLKEVAYMSGYNDYKYFSVEFKRLVGVSPSEYMYNFEKQS